VRILRRSPERRYRDGKLVAVVLLNSPRFRIIFAAVCALVVFGAACSSGGKKSQPQATTTTVPSRHVHALTLGKIIIQSAGPALTLNKNTKAAVLKATQDYVDSAVYAPLDRGTVGTGYAALFDSSIRAAATGRDEHALTESMRNVSGYSASAAPVELSGLVDSSGALVYLATDLTLNEKLTTAAGKFKVARAIELTFSPHGKKWLVTAYRVKSTRSKVNPARPRHRATTTTSKP
jgi:hypothetical protein